MSNMQVVGIIVPKAPLTFAHCTATSNSSYHPQFPSWSLMPGPGPSTVSETIPSTRSGKRVILKRKKKNLVLLGYFSDIWLPCSHRQCSPWAVPPAEVKASSRQKKYFNSAEVDMQENYKIMQRGNCMYWSPAAEIIMQGEKAGVV